MLKVLNKSVLRNIVEKKLIIDKNILFYLCMNYWLFAQIVFQSQTLFNFFKLRNIVVFLIKHHAKDNKIDDIEYENILNSSTKIKNKIINVLNLSRHSY